MADAVAAVALKKLAWRVTLPTSVTEGEHPQPSTILEFLVSDDASPTGEKLVILQLDRDGLANLLQNVEEIQSAVVKLSTPRTVYVGNRKCHKRIQCMSGQATEETVKMSAPPLHIQTPLIYSNSLSSALGMPVELKMEALQPCGSFKLRGIGLSCQRAVHRGSQLLVSSSGGNAGLAVAHSARALSVSTIVVVPTSTPASVVARLRSYGAQVEVHGSQWSEAHARAESVAAANNGALIHPFEGAETWEGHGSVIAEIFQQRSGEPPSAIILSVGGGGLLMGVLTGLREVGWYGKCDVIAVETEGADCLAQSLAEGRIVTLPAITSVAKSLGAAAPSPTAFAAASDPAARVRSLVVTDRDAVGACMRLADDHRILVEPACGAALAPVYGAAPALRGGAGTVVAIVCGGAAVDMASLTAMAAVFPPST